MSVVRKLQRARQLLQTAGLGGLLHAVLKRVFPSGNPWLRWDRRVLFESTIDLATVRTDHPATARPLSPEATLQLVGFNDLREAVLVAALRRGESCWCLTDDSVRVGYAWVSSPSIIRSDTGYRLDLDAQRHYFWRDVYIKPEFRGQGRIQQIFCSWVRSLGTEGIVNVYTEVDPSNLPSLQAHRRLGFADIGSLFMLCVLGARFCFYRGPRFPSFQFQFLPHNLYVNPQRY